MSHPSRRGRAGRLRWAHRRLAWAVMLVMMASGCLVWLRGQFADGPWAWQAHNDLVVHGVSALLALMVLGSVLPTHVVVAWQAGRNRLLGALSLLVMALLSLSGALLYYGSADARDLVVSLHGLLGWALVLVFPLHAWARWRRGG